MSANDDPGDGSAVRSTFPEGLTLDKANRAKEAVSAAAITSLVTYGRHLASVAGEVVDEVVAERLRAVWDNVWSRFSADEQASGPGALEWLATQPDNSRPRAADEDRLGEHIRADPDFTASLAELVARVNPLVTPTFGCVTLARRPLVGTARSGAADMRPAWTSTWWPRATVQ